MSEEGLVGVLEKVNKQLESKNKVTVCAVFYFDLLYHYCKILLYSLFKFLVCLNFVWLDS